MRNQPGAQIRGFPAFFGIAFEQFAKASRCGAIAPVRRTEALHSPAFLVDENRRAGIADAVSQFGTKRRHLVRILAIPCKQDESKRLHVPEERSLLVFEFGSFTAKN